MRFRMDVRPKRTTGRRRHRDVDQRGASGRWLHATGDHVSFTRGARLEEAYPWSDPSFVPVTAALAGRSPALRLRFGPLDDRGAGVSIDDPFAAEVVARLREIHDELIRRSQDGMASALAGGITKVILAPVKTAISVPDEVFRAVDVQAKRLKLSRSEFFARAAVRLLQELEDERLKTSYDEAFADDDVRDARFRGRATRAALLAVEWEDE